VGKGGHVVDTLLFAGDDTPADFGLMPDGQGGTDIVFATAAPASSMRVQHVTAWHEAAPSFLPPHALF
jgi:hypothetical protein